MKKSLRLKIVLAALIGCIAVESVFLIRAEWQILGWKGEVFGLCGLVASNRAARDFGDGKLRLLKLDGESNDWRFTGEMDGPFEVWNPQFYPSLGAGHRYSTEQYVEFYNRAMKNIYAHPDIVKRKVETEKPELAGENQ